MAPAYPMKGYRTSRNASSFQRSSVRAAGALATPRPANDNYRMPVPANDNMKLSAPSPKEFAKASLRLGLAQALKYFELGKYLYDAYRGSYQPYADIRPASYGWSLFRDCPKPREFVQYITGSLSPDVCFLAQAVAVQPLGTAPPVSALAQTARFWAANPLIANRYDLGQTWHKAAGVATPASSPAFVQIPEEFPRENPWMNPSVLPIKTFVPLARPPAYADARAQERAAGREAEWTSPTRYVPKPKLAPEPVFYPDPLVNPFAPQPGVRIQLYPRLQTLPGSHLQRVPPKGTKERKFILSRTGVVSLVMNAFTETADFIDVMYQSIPEDLRPRWNNGAEKKLSLSDKVEWIYKMYWSIDAEVLFKNLWTNEVEDAIYGTAGRLQGKANRGLGLSTGLRPIPKPGSLSDDIGAIFY